LSGHIHGTGVLVHGGYNCSVRRNSIYSKRATYCTGHVFSSGAETEHHHEL